MKHPLLSLVLLCLVWLPGASVHGAAPKFVEVKTLMLKQSFGTTKDWKVTAYQPDEHQEVHLAENVESKVCFWVDPAGKESSCQSVSGTYGYQSVKQLTVVPLRKANPAVWGVLLDVKSSGGGSGWRDSITIWTYESSEDEFKKAIGTEVSNIDEYRVFSEGPLAGFLVIASGLWVGDEGHFGPHYFSMEMLKNGRLGEGSAERYRYLLQYITSKKYESEEIRVITPELDNIQRFLGIIYPKGGPIR
jgi:hypothetical protein